MAISVTVRPSADAGNGIYLGSDAGLMASPLPAGQFGNILNTIDNSQSGTATGTTYYYPLSYYANSSSTVTGIPVAQQILLTRSGVITAAYGYVGTANTTSPVYGTVYAPDPATSMPGAKTCDLFALTASPTGQQPAAMVNTTTTLTGNSLYWLVTWCTATTGFPAITHRSGSAYQQGRLNAVTATWATVPPIGVTGTSTWASYTTGPASAAAFFPITSAPSLTAPQFFFGVRNV